MKINRQFNLAIMERFLDKDELEEFQQEYDEAKILSQGRLNLNKNNVKETT